MKIVAGIIAFYLCYFFNDAWCQQKRQLWEIILSQCQLNSKDSLFYKNNKLCNGTDTVIGWYNNALLDDYFAVFYYEKGKRIKLVELYRDMPRPTIKATFLFKNQIIRDGIYPIKDVNGQIVEEIEFKNGYRDGIDIHINSNSNKVYRIEMGKIHCDLYDNGIIKQEMRSYNDTLTYPVKITDYYPDGAIKDEIHYMNLNTPNGFEQEWFENGQIKSISEWHNGKPIGKWEYYDISGTLIKEEVFDTLLPPTVRRYNIAGKSIKGNEYKNIDDLKMNLVGIWESMADSTTTMEIKWDKIILSGQLVIDLNYASYSLSDTAPKMYLPYSNATKYFIYVYYPELPYSKVWYGVEFINDDYLDLINLAHGNNVEALLYFKRKH